MATLNFTTPTMVSQVTGFPAPDNVHLASEFAGMTCSSASATASLMTFNVIGDLQVSNGSTFTVVTSGFTPAAYNGTFTGTVNIAARTRFTVPVSANPGACTVLGTVSKTYNIPFGPPTVVPYTQPSLTTDTRKWDVFAADLAFPYDGKDGYTYSFLGDTYGHDWNGPNTTHSNAGSTTVAAGSNGLLCSSFTGTQTIALAATGSFTTTGGYAVVQLGSNASALAYFKYTARSTTNLTSCTLIYTTDPTKALTTGDVIKGDDSWTGAGWRSNTLFRSTDTTLSDGMAIESFRALTSQGIAQQAIPGRHDTQSAAQVFAPNRTIGATGATVSANVATITTTAAHRFVTGQSVTISGVTNAAFNGTFVITSTPTTDKFTYALTLANQTSTVGGTVTGVNAATSLTRGLGFVVTVVTPTAHFCAVGSGVTISGSGALACDGEFYVYTVDSATQFTIVSFGSNGSGTGSYIPATFAFSPTGPSSLGNASDGSIIPSGAVAITGQAATIATTAASWSGGSVTLTVASHNAYVGESVVVAGLAPSTLNGTFVVTGITGNTIKYALADPGTISDQIGTVAGTRHYCYYWSVCYFSVGSAPWFTNYCGIAYSDDKGNTWTREGVTGATYNTVDSTKVWGNDSQWNDNFQQQWPVLGTDGYVYCLSAPNGRTGDAYMSRVPQANILTKSSYTYWDGTTWNASITAASPVYTGPQGEPSMFFHQGSNQWISTYLNQGIFGGNLSIRSASNPQGPWSDSQVLLYPAFGNMDFYGGFIHPASNTSPQSATDFYFHVSLFAPYETFLMKTTITLQNNGKFFRMF